MVHLGDVPQNFIKLISKAVSTFLLVALFFILQYLFDMDFFCSCTKGVHWYNVLFLAAPALILTSIVTLIDSFYQKWIFSCRCNYCCRNFGGFIASFFGKYLHLSAVWVATVLLDGDWYFCLQTNLNDSQRGIPCRRDLTFEETLIKNDYLNTSRELGFAVISLFFLLWNFFECLQAFCIRWKMWQRSSVSTYDLCCPPYYRWLYEELLSEEVSLHLKEELRKIAKKRAKELCKEHLMIIENHELPGKNKNLNGRNVINSSDNLIRNANGNPDDNINGNPSGNLNGNANDNPSGNVNWNPNGNSNENPNSKPNVNPNDNPKDNANPNGNLNGNTNGNPNGNVNDNPNGNLNGNGNENPNGNGNEKPMENVNGNPNVNPNGNGNGNENPNPKKNVNGNPNVNPNDIPNGNNEKDTIFDTWQNISHSYFYMKDERF